MISSRTLLITGSSSGIGRAICDSLLQQNHTVLGVARHPEFDISSDNYQPIQLDLLQLDEIDKCLRSALAHHPALDAVILNAGSPAFGNLEQLSQRKVREFIDLNLTSHLLVARSTLPFLKRQEYSDMILIGSESALRGGKRGSIYCAAKFGLRGFAQSLREECASSGVRVTIIHPGMVRTGFFDDLDFAPGEAAENAIEPEDVAAAVNLVLNSRPGTVFDEMTLSPLKKVVRAIGGPHGKT